MIPLKLYEKPFHELAYRTSGPKGRVLQQSLPFYRATASDLPPGLGSIVITSDLQGRETGAKNRLLGEVVADEVARLQELGEIERIGLAILAGDLYDYPDLHKRGGTGIVDPVWQAFAQVAPNVVGVKGNHDVVEAPERLPSHARVLDGEIAHIGGLAVGGVGGIIGDPRRHERESEAQFIEGLEQITIQRPDILVLHQGPDDPERGRRGDPTVRLSLETGYQGLTVFGHSHWQRPFLVDVGQGQGLNVDGRVILINSA